MGADNPQIQAVIAEPPGDEVSVCLYYMAFTACNCIVLTGWILGEAGVRAGDSWNIYVGNEEAYGS